MAGYIRSKGQLLSRSQIRKSLQRTNPTDHERRRADTVRVRNPIPYNAAYYGHKLHCDQNEKLSMIISNNSYTAYIAALRFVSQLSHLYYS